MYRFSEHGIKNEGLFCTIYNDFIDFCKSKASIGTFSTYMDGEPFFMCNTIEISYRAYLEIISPEKIKTNWRKTK